MREVVEMEAVVGYEVLSDAAPIVTMHVLPRDVCEGLIAASEAMQGWRAGGVLQRTDAGVEQQVAMEYRSVQMLDAVAGDVPYEVLKSVYELVLEALCEAVHGETFVFPAGINVLAYGTGDYHHPHRDWGAGAEERVLTMVVYLNDNVVGGATVFPEQDVEVRPDAGTVLIFPSDLLHGSTEIVAGSKHALVAWLVR